MEWLTIPDDHIRHIWRDPETGEEVSVGPEWYAESGTPQNELGDDYVYVRTEILIGSRDVRQLPANLPSSPPNLRLV